MDPQEWLDYINQHKGIVGHVPYRTKAEQDGAVDPNPKPPMDLVFGDGSTMQAIFEDDGSVTVTKPLKPGPKGATPAAPKIYTDPTDGSKWTLNADGTKTPLTDAAAPKGPKTTVSGSSTSDQFIAQTDPTTGEVTWLPNKNYVAPTASSTDSTAADRLNFDKQKYANEQDSARTTAQLKAYQDDLQNQIDAGKLNNSQAIAMFDAQVSMLTAGQNAGQDAVNYAKDANANRVGPGFGQHFADALSGRGVNFQGADFMYQTPDYAAIARQATAEAIKHLSPYAASIAGTMAPPGGYAPSGGGGYVPGGGGGAGGGSAPTASGVPLAPGVTRDAQGNPGFTAPDGRFIPAYTTPTPPQPGYGAYRPGG